MTSEEAIEILTRYKEESEEDYYVKRAKALDMAIKALEVDLDELKRKILMEVDGGTDDKWLRYCDVCDNISKSIDEYKAESENI